MAFLAFQAVYQSLAFHPRRNADEHLCGNKKAMLGPSVSRIQVKPFSNHSRPI